MKNTRQIIGSVLLSIIAGLMLLGLIVSLFSEGGQVPPIEIWVLSILPIGIGILAWLKPKIGAWAGLIFGAVLVLFSVIAASMTDLGSYYIIGMAFLCGTLIIGGILVLTGIKKREEGSDHIAG